MSQDGRSIRAQQLREERRKQILETSIRVFSEQGYHHTSISDLVKAAGVARGTFYLYFESKNGIFLELLDELIARFRDSVVGVDASPDAPPLAEQLEGTVTRILQTAEAHRPFARIVFREAVGLDETVDARLQAFESALQFYIAEALNVGAELGWLRRCAADIVAVGIYGAIRQVIYRFIAAEEDDVDIPKVAHEIVAWNLRGLASA